MQRTITINGVDFEVEFDTAGEVESICIGQTEVSDVISNHVAQQIVDLVERNSVAWFDEYLREINAEELAARRAA